MYLVAKFITQTEQGTVWEFQGIFDTREKAVAACRTPMYCIQSVILNQELPDESGEFTDCEYPILADPCPLLPDPCLPEANA